MLKHKTVSRETFGVWLRTRPDIVGETFESRTSSHTTGMAAMQYPDPDNPEELLAQAIYWKGGHITYHLREDLIA